MNLDVCNNDRQALLMASDYYEERGDLAMARLLRWRYEYWVRPIYDDFFGVFAYRLRTVLDPRQYPSNIVLPDLHAPYSVYDGTVAALDRQLLRIRVVWLAQEVTPEIQKKFLESPCLPRKVC